MKNKAVIIIVLVVLVVIGVVIYFFMKSNKNTPQQNTKVTQSVSKHDESGLNGLIGNSGNSIAGFTKMLEFM